MAQLQSPLSDQVSDLIDKALDLYNHAKPAEIMAVLQKAWDLLPNPKNQWDESYSIAHDFVLNHLEDENFDKAREWAETLLSCPVGDADPGEAELTYGMVCFEMGDFAEAMDFFADAHEKSGGEIWDAVDPKFEHFFQEQMAEDEEEEWEEEEGEGDELDDEIFEKIQHLADEGNDLMDEEDYDSAVNKFNEALNLLPEPRGDWEASTWLYASVGDAHFFKTDYAAAAEAFYQAFQSPNGMINPFVLLRLGQSLLETGDEPNATEYLLRAYMVEGRDIFDEENPKYFQFLESKVELDKDLE